MKESTSKVHLHAAVLAVLLCSVAGAETVYKQIGPDGSITFSAKPSPMAPGVTVVPVEIETRRSEGERKAGEQRLPELERTATRLEMERKKEQQRRAKRIESARQELRESRAALEEAKKKTVDDWQYLVRGGRVLKQGYFERVEAATQRVRAAEESLREAGGEPP